MLTPMYDNIVVKVVDVGEKKTEGGIIISTNPITEPYSTGIVVKVGHGYRVNGELIPLQVKEGDTVLYRKGSNIDVDDDGEKYQVISENVIFAIKTDK